MEILVAGVVAAVVLAVLLLGARTGRPRVVARPARRARPGGAAPGDRRVEVVLDVGSVDPGLEALRRLVDDAARRSFAASEVVAEVVVSNREGEVLGVRRREEPLEVAIPGSLYEPHAGRHHGPDPAAERSGTEGSARPGVSRDVPLGVPGRPLAERFDVPAEVRERIEAPEDPVAVVAALLEVAGREPELDDDVLRCGSEAVVVVRAPIGEPLDADALNRAFRRFRASGASRGLVVTPGFMDPADVRRRELLEPALLHAGPEGIQRMADAVAVGADPIAFAVPAEFEPTGG